MNQPAHAATQSSGLSELRMSSTSGTRNYAVVKLPKFRGSDLTEEHYEHVRNIRRNINPDDISRRVNEKFIQMEDAGEVLGISLRSGLEAVFHGPPGYGKSDLIRFALQETGLDDFTAFVDFGSSTTEADLYGGFDAAHYSTHKEIRYKTEQSWMKFPIAVFEEALDGSDPRVLQSLRSILTSGIFYKNGIPEPVMTQLALILTNRKPSEFAEVDTASAAFLSRFPLEVEVVWKDHSARAYMDLLGRKFREVDPTSLHLVSEVVAHTSATANAAGVQRHVAPRECIQAVELMLNVGSLEPVEEEVGMDPPLHVISVDHLSTLRFMPRVFPDTAAAAQVFASHSESMEIEKVMEVLNAGLEELAAVDLTKASNISGFIENLEAVGIILDREEERLNQWSDARRPDMTSFIGEARTKFVALYQPLIPQQTQS